MTWSDGRRLATVTENGSTYTYAYNGDGLRVEKVVNGIPYRYLYDGGNLIRIEKGSGTSLQYIDFLYDGATLFGFRFCDVYTPINRIYYYLYGHGGNVEGVLDSQGNLLVRYTYDAWGNFEESVKTTDPGALAAIALNPFRYRGYVYDFETGFYYLQSRYYDPETGRFISPDDTEYLGANGDLNSYNLFAYCNNDPVNYSDESGHMPKWAQWVVGGLAVAGLVVATVLTCGAAGAGAAAVGASMLTGGLVSAGINAVDQLHDGEEFNCTELAISALSGTAYGLVVGLTGGAAGGAVAGKFAVAGGTSLLNSWNQNATFSETMTSLGTSLLISGAVQGAGYLAGKFAPQVLSKIAPKNPNQLVTMGDIGSALWDIPAVKTGVMRFAAGVAKSIFNDF